MLINHSLGHFHKHQYVLQTIYLRILKIVALILDMRNPRPREKMNLIAKVTVLLMIIIVYN